MIAIIDYGMGNLRSVQKGFEKIGAEAVITADPRVVLEADKLSCRVLVLSAPA